MPPSGEKMWQTNYMETYNKSQKSGRKYSTPSRYNTPKRKPISERLEYLARPKTPATGRPKTASSVQQQNTNVTTESSKPIISFDEFNKQFSKVKFDNCGYVVHPYSCPWEIAEFGVQGKQLQLSDRDKGENKGQPILDAADSLPKTDIKLESAKEENKENTEEETEDQKDKTEEEKQDEVPKSHTPVPDTTTDKPKEYHWLCWPEPQSKEDIPLRSQTSLGFHRAPTPYGGGPGDDIEDRPSSVIPGYAFGDTEDITRGPPLTYVPELKTWVNSSSQYDKDIAQSIMTTMYPNVLAPPLPPEALRPKRQMTFTYGGRRSNNSNYNSMSDPLIHYSQSWRPLYEDRRTVSRQEALRHSVPSFPQIPAMERSKTDIKPMSNRRPIRYPRGEDYIHERSMFMTTQPSCSGHFIIHPDWVSERLGRRKIIFGKKNGQSRNGLRYGTAQEI